MRFASLGSGSSGNATLICSGDTAVMLDCGFSVAETTRRLARVGVRPDELDAIIVTHEHDDHIGGVARLARRHDVTVYDALFLALARKEHADITADDRLEAAFRAM